MAKISMMELLSLQQGMTEPQKAMFRNQLQQRQKNRGLTFILALFLGGSDRIYLGQIGLGILNILTFQGLGIWGIIDLFTAMGRTDEYNRKLALEISQTIKLQN